MYYCAPNFPKHNDSVLEPSPPNLVYCSQCNFIPIPTQPYPKHEPSPFLLPHVCGGGGGDDWTCYYCVWCSHCMPTQGIALMYYYQVVGGGDGTPLVAKLCVWAGGWVEPAMANDLPNLVVSSFPLPACAKCVGILRWVVVGCCVLHPNPTIPCVLVPSMPPMPITWLVFILHYLD